MTRIYDINYIIYHGPMQELTTFTHHFKSDELPDYRLYTVLVFCINQMKYLVEKIYRRIS